PSSSFPPQLNSPRRPNIQPPFRPRPHFRAPIITAKKYPSAMGLRRETRPGLAPPDSGVRGRSPIRPATPAPPPPAPPQTRPPTHDGFLRMFRPSGVLSDPAFARI